MRLLPLVLLNLLIRDAQNAAQCLLRGRVTEKYWAVRAPEGFIPVCSIAETRAEAIERFVSGFFINRMAARTWLKIGIICYFQALPALSA